MTDTPTWLERLNPPQREAVIHEQGPLLVLAGAGSGKTRVLTHRIAYLIEAADVSPDAIVAVTFTNRAAGEMRHRVDALIDDDDASARIIISTFHSLGARLLRTHAPMAGLEWNFSIYDDTDQRRLIRDVLVHLSRDKSRANVNHHRRYIDACKNQGLTPEQAMERAFEPAAEEDAHFYQLYQDFLGRAGAVDFGDLILGPLEMFRRHPRLAKRLSRRWRYLMVDEFQDTNPAQYQLLEFLCTAHNNLAVVGDDDQAIYRWRGADSSHILGFHRAFDDVEVKVVKLEQNYRSTGLILDAANDVIAHNELRHPKTLWTDRPRGEPITLFTGQDDREEAAYVAESIFDQLRRGASPEDFAIFYRTNAQGRLFEELLRQWGIDYRIVGGISFYDREEIKDLLAYLRAALNPYDDVATARIINKPTRGVGKTTIEKLRAALSVSGVDCLQDAAHLALQDPSDQGDLFGPLALSPEHQQTLDAVRSLRGVSRKGLAAFLDILDQTRDDLVQFETLAPIVERIITRTDYGDYLRGRDLHEAEDRLRNMGELLSALEEFERDPSTPSLLEAVRSSIPDDDDDLLTTSEASIRLRAFLDRSALVRQTSGDDDLGVVTLMTIHGAKGLEFDTVFLVGMEEETFPSVRDDDDLEELAEERRLAYVAITRAQNRLFITNARRRRVYGQFRNSAPSRYLLDIDEQRLRIDPKSTSSRIDFGYARRQPSRRFGTPPSTDHQFDQSPSADDFDQSPPEWDYFDVTEPEPVDEDRPSNLVGATVSHSRFGVGEVLAVSGDGDKARLTIDFPSVGPKKVIRKFLKILG